MNNTYQLSKIKQTLKRIRDPLIRDRLQMVERYYECGTFRAAGAKCGCAHSTVKHWTDRYKAEGLKGLRTLPRSGRPRELNFRTEERIRKEVFTSSKRDGWNIKQIREYIRKKGRVTYTQRHTMRIAQRWGLAGIMPRPQYAHARKSEQLAFLKEKHGSVQPYTQGLESRGRG